MSAQSGLRRISWLGLALLAAAVTASLAFTAPANAGDRHDSRHYRGHGHGHGRSHSVVVVRPHYVRPRPPVVVLAPPVYVAPPRPVYVAPPPVVYYPPPAVVGRPYYGAPAVVAQRAPTGNDIVCREYQSPVQVGGVVQQSYGTACLQPDGSWRIVN